MGGNMGGVLESSVSPSNLRIQGSSLHFADFGNRAASMSGKMDPACEWKELSVEEQPVDTAFTNYEK